MAKRTLSRQVKLQTDHDLDLLSEFSRQQVSTEEETSSNRPKKFCNDLSRPSSVLDSFDAPKFVSSPKTIFSCSSDSISELNEGQSATKLETRPNSPLVSSLNLEHFKSNLSAWSITEGIPQKSISKLLKILKTVPCLSDLPSDSRALLQTPRYTMIHSMENGEFLYLGLVQGIRNILQSMKDPLPLSIKLLIGVDGLPITKSSRSQLWPQLCKVTSVPNSEVFPVGIFHGSEKPSSPNEYLQMLIAELRNVIEDGIKIDSKTIVVEHVGFVCDVPAKSFILNIKGHSGFHSCTRCNQKGKYMSNRVCMSTTKGIARTHEDFCNNTDQNYHNEASESIIASVPNLNVVKDFSLDYMHLVCLGVMKKLIHFWTKGELKNRLSPRVVNDISNDLELLKPYIPSEFARKPRSLLEAPRWKATEFRLFLLYTGVLVLKSHIDKDLYLNFLSLHVAMLILLSPNYCYQENYYASKLLEHFVKTFSKLYGPQYVSHNVHNLLHLADDVHVFGALDSCSAFQFENYMQNVKKMLKKHNQPLQQIARRYQERKNALPFVKILSGPEKEFVLKVEHDGGPLPEGCQSPQYKSVQIRDQTFSTKKNDCCCSLIDGTSLKIMNIAYSEHLGIVVVGKKLRKFKNLYENPCPSSSHGINVVKVAKSLTICPLKNIESKLMMLPYKKDKYVIFPLLHSSST